MIGALAALVLLGGASLVVGQALAALSGGATREQPGDVSWLAPAFGLGTLLVVGGIAVRLPGHAITAAIVLAGAVVGAFVYVRGRVRGARAAALLGAPVVAITVLAAALPFAIAGHVGVLGVGLINDDMASHLIIADYIGDPAGVVPSFIKGGYPIGPHALVAAIGRGTGADLIDVFAGLTLALPALLGLLGLGMLEGLPRYRRILGACLIALSYLGVSYLAQGAFKEPVLSLLVIGFALCLARLIGLERGREAEPDETASPRVSPLLLGLPLGVLAAAVVFTYSLPGLLWLGAVGAALVLARVLLLEPRPKLPPNWPRKAAPYAIGAVAVVALATVQEWSRIADFSRVSALNPERFGSQLGNLRGSLSPLEVLGIWPSGDFRVTAGDGGLPALVFYAGAALAAAALLLGLSSAWRRRQLTLAAAAVAVGAVWALLALIGSPYVAAKALAIAAPLVMAVAVRGTFGARGPALLLGAGLLLAAALSSFLVLRQAPVAPTAHADSLAEIRSTVEGGRVLFLGRDDFIGWELRGSGEITGIVTNFYDVEDARPRFKKGKGGGEKFDIDAVFPKTVDNFRWILATTGGPASSVPPRFETAVEADDYVLYERTGSIGKRKTLDEGTAPGAVLDCAKSEDRAISQESGSAIVWDPPPVISSPEKWAPSDEPSDGAPVSQRLRLPAAGRYLISLEYDSRRPLQFVAPQLGLSKRLPANLDFRGETPTFPVGEVVVDRPLRTDVQVEPVAPNAFARLLGAPNEAHLRSLTATPIGPGAVHRVPLRDACEQYVDWYRSG